MINKDDMLKKIDNMPIEELQKLICQALDESGIKYHFGGDEISIDGYSLGEFFNQCLIAIKKHR